MGPAGKVRGFGMTPWVESGRTRASRGYVSHGDSEECRLGMKLEFPPLPKSGEGVGQPAGASERRLGEDFVSSASGVTEPLCCKPFLFQPFAKCAKNKAPTSFILPAKGRTRPKRDFSSFGSRPV